MYNLELVAPKTWSPDMDANTTAAELFERANAAERDAIRWRRDPHGQHMATLRHRDAKALRDMARARLRT